MADMSCELEWASSVENLGASLFETMKDFESITYRIVSLVNPYNGWPLVTFEGTGMDMSAFVLEYCSGDFEQAEDLLQA